MSGYAEKEDTGAKVANFCNGFTPGGGGGIALWHQTETTMLLKNGTTSTVIDTTQYTMSIGPSATAATWPDLDTQPTDIAYVGVLSSGSPFAYVGQQTFGTINFGTPGNPPVFQWKVASRAVAVTAIANIIAFAAVPNAAGTLNTTTGGVS